MKADAGRYRLPKKSLTRSSRIVPRRNRLYGHSTDERRRYEDYLSGGKALHTH